MKLNKFYIICPAFNAEKVIAKSIGSVEAQTYSNYELIVVDDGSFDLTAQIVNDASKTNSRIRLIRKNNEGVFKARNTGIDFLKQHIASASREGAYILFLDSDDFLEPNCLSVLNETVISENYPDFICYNSNRFDYSNTKTKSFYLIQENKCVFGTPLILKECIVDNTYSYIWSYCIKADLLFLNWIFPDEFTNSYKVCEDYLRLLPVLLNSTKAVFIKECLYNYCNNDASLVSNLKIDDWVGWLLIVDYINNSATNRFPEIKRFYNNNNLSNVWQIMCLVLRLSCALSYSKFRSYLQKIKHISLLNLCYHNANSIHKKRLLKSIINGKYAYVRLYSFLMNFKYQINRNINKRNKKIRANYLRNWNLFEKDLSIISNCCLSGYLYKNLSTTYKSPTIWCLMEPADIIKFCLNLEEYLKYQLTKSEPFTEIYKKMGGNEISFPCAKLGDLKIMFPHSHSFESAKNDWERRKKRINLEKTICIIFIDHCYEPMDYYDNFARISFKKAMIGYKKLRKKEYYQIKCPNNREWFNIKKHSIAYWETINWSRIIKGK